MSRWKDHRNEYKAGLLGIEVVKVCILRGHVMSEGEEVPVWNGRQARNYVHVALYLFYLLDSTSFRNFQSCFFAEDEIFFSYLSGKTEARACDGNGCDHFFCINIAGKPANVSSISIKLFPYFFLRREVFFFIGKRMRSMRNKGTLLQYGFRFLSRKINHEDCSERSVIQITVFSYIIVGLKAIIAVIFKQIFEMCLPDVQH